MPALPSRPSPAQPGPAAATEFFPQYSFFFKTYHFSLSREETIGNKGNIWYKRRKLTSCVEATLPAAQRLTEAHTSCCAAAFCANTMLHTSKSLQLSQISMLTFTLFTVTPSRGVA